jgi:hypothetical protein
MGIDTEFRRLLEARYESSFGDGPVPQSRGLLIVDLLTTAFSAIGPNYNYTFTGDDFVRFVFQHASDGFDGGQIKTCVVCVDLQEWVPKEKETEQKKRSRNNSHQPYPDRCKFTRAGTNLHVPRNCTLSLKPLSVYLRHSASRTERRRATLRHPPSSMQSRTTGSSVALYSRRATRPSLCATKRLHLCV